MIHLNWFFFLNYVNFELILRKPISKSRFDVLIDFTFLPDKDQSIYFITDFMTIQTYLN